MRESEESTPEFHGGEAVNFSWRRSNNKKETLTATSQPNDSAADSSDSSNRPNLLTASVSPASSTALFDSKSLLSTKQKMRRQKQQSASSSSSQHKEKSRPVTAARRPQQNQQQERQASTAVVDTDKSYPLQPSETREVSKAPLQEQRRTARSRQQHTIRILMDQTGGTAKEYHDDEPEHDHPSPLPRISSSSLGNSRTFVSDTGCLATTSNVEGEEEPEKQHPLPKSQLERPQQLTALLENNDRSSSPNANLDMNTASRETLPNEIAQDEVERQIDSKPTRSLLRVDAASEAASEACVPVAGEIELEKSSNNINLNTSSSTKQPRLDWSFVRDGHLYDRESETQQLRDAFHSHFDNSERLGSDTDLPPSFVVVSGLSGTGKSALTKSVLKPLVTERQGYYLTGKFDQLRHSEPYAPFVNAINDFVYYLLTEQSQEHQYGNVSNWSTLERLQTEILSALSPEACHLLLQMIPTLTRILRMDTADSLEPDRAAANETIDLTSVSTSKTGAIWEASQDRAKVIFRRFLKVICKPERPICLVIDDLQWADDSSLDLLESLIAYDLQDGTSNTDTSRIEEGVTPAERQVVKQQGLLLVGICRSNEVNVDHKLASMLRRLEDEQHALINNIIVRNLTFKATNQLMSDILQQPMEICTPLTEMIHGQTKGNVFYVLHYIKALYADAVLIPDQVYGTDGWLWDDERWQQLYSRKAKEKNSKERLPVRSQSSCVSAASAATSFYGELQPTTHSSATQSSSCQQNLPPVVDLIVRQLRRLPSDTQLFLRICACTGSEIDLALIERVLVNIDLLESVHLAVDEGLLVALERRHGQATRGSAVTNSELLQEVKASTEMPISTTTPPRYYMFAHDKIRQGAYSLIPDDCKSAAHLSIGRMLFKNMQSMAEFNEHIFVIVHQMTRGMTHIQDQSERDGLAALCLKAGNRAILSSDFHAAVQYFVIGTTLLSQGHDYWNRQYELSLELYNSLAEADYCVADFELMDVAVLEVLQNATCFRDMIRAYSTQVYALGARFMLQEAIDLGLQVLERFDQSFSDPSPKLRSALHPMSQPMKLKRTLGWKTKSQLLYLPNMNDGDKLAAMGILNLLTTYSLIGRPSLFPYVAARLVKLSLEHGLCAISAPGFAFFGLWLCSIGDIRGGYRYGSWALDIQERYQSTMTEWVPRVYSVFYGWIAPWKQPLHSTFGPTLHAHTVGLETGDIEYSMIGAHVYSINAFIAGKRLDILEKELGGFVDLMNKYKQGPWAAATSVQLQMIHNLMGRAEDPLVLRGEIITDEKVREIALVPNMESYETYFIQVMVWSLLLAYHFGNVRKALATADDCREAMKGYGSSLYLACIQYFYDGMTALLAAASPRYARRTKDHMNVARMALAKLKRAAKHCPENCLHKVLLMQAEIAAVNGDLEKGLGLFERSIELSEEHGFLQDGALAHERAGLALRKARHRTKANFHLGRAADMYSMWGANAKVAQLRRLRC